MRRGWMGMIHAKASDKRTPKQSKASYQVDLQSDAQDESTTDEAKLPIHGAVVQSILQNSPASIAGIKVGDTITEINLQHIKGVEDLIFAIGKSPVGSRVAFTINRNGEQLQIETTVGERPDLP